MKPFTQARAAFAAVVGEIKPIATLLTNLNEVV